MELMIDNPDTFHVLSADASKIPSPSVVWHLFHAQFASQYGERSGEEMFADLEQFIASYNSDGAGGSALFKRVGENYFVAVVTPIMRRVHQNIPQAAELLLVDASGGMDRQKHRIYMFVVPTAAGGLPAGSIITDCERKEVFSVALDALLNLLPSEKFFGKGAPAVIVTDNDLKEREPLARVFPSAKLLLCQFHVLKAVWSWLCNARHKVDKTARQSIYFHFKGCLYARTADDFVKRSTELLESDVCKEDVNLRNYLVNLLSDKASWATCFRNNLPTRGSNTTNYVEVVFKILKDTIFDRVMAYNITQLLDYLVTRFEQYFHGRLLGFANGRYRKSLLRNMLAQSSCATKEVVDHQDGTFSVPSHSSPDSLHSVDIMRGICDCEVGSNGCLCKHMSAVINLLDLKFSSDSAIKVVSTNTKGVMFLVATGHQPPSDWLGPLLLNDGAPLDCRIDTHCAEGMAGSGQSNSGLPVLQPADSAPDSNSTLVSCDVPAALDMWGVLMESLRARVTEGLHKSPEIFIPAVKKCAENISEFVSTESSLVSMLYTMGKYSGCEQKRTRQHLLSGRRHGGVKIGVQPTAISRRKYCLSGKRKQSAGRPIGNVRKPITFEEQSSGSFNAPRLKKRKASIHDLQSCVSSNVSLGLTRHAKN